MWQRDLRVKAYIDNWTSQHGSEPATGEAAGYEWHYTLLVVKDRIDDDDDGGGDDDECS